MSDCTLLDFPTSLYVLPTYPLDSVAESRGFPFGAICLNRLDGRRVGMICLENKRTYADFCVSNLILARSEGPGCNTAGAFFVFKLH